MNYTRLPPTNNHELELNTQFAYLYSGLITHLYHAFQRVRYHLFSSKSPIHVFVYNSRSFMLDFIDIFLKCVLGLITVHGTWET